MDQSEIRELFRATANVTSKEGDDARIAFAAAIDTPILQEIKLRSVVREMFSVEMLEPGAQASYPIADDFDIPVWVLPGLGYMAQNFVEGKNQLLS